MSCPGRQPGLDPSEERRAQRQADWPAARTFASAAALASSGIRVDAAEVLEAAKANGRILRVMENYLFYEPLRKLKAAAESGEIGEVCGYHMKMTGTGLGGWDVPVSSFEWQLEQMRRGDLTTTPITNAGR